MTFEQSVYQEGALPLTLFNANIRVSHDIFAQMHDEFFVPYFVFILHSISTSTFAAKVLDASIGLFTLKKARLSNTQHCCADGHSFYVGNLQA